MSRVQPVSTDDFSAGLRERLGDDALANPTTLGAIRVWAQCPDLAATFLDFKVLLDRSATLNPRLREVVRLRVAFHNQCRSCMAMRSSAAIDDGMDDAIVCELVAPQESHDLSERERAALHYADLLATDHLAIDDSTFERLRCVFAESEIVELGIFIGMCIGFGRVSSSWDLVDDLPDQFRDKSAAAVPWSDGALTR